MAPSRGITAVRYTISRFQCQSQCSTKGFSTTRTLPSGHNRWSKIKHDKAKVDAGKNKQRSIFAKEIAHASKLFGPDPNVNNRLAEIITKAKREGFAKQSIESAIARGQGKSMGGGALESVTVEGLLPNNVAVIVECETDNRLRTLQEVRLVLKNSGGSTSPVSYLFQKQGRIMFEAKEGISVDEVLEPALEAGATDVLEGSEGRVVVCTEPSDTKAVGEAVANALGLDIATAEIIWDPNEDTRVEITGEDSAQELTTFVDAVQDAEPSVQTVAMNVTQGKLKDAVWVELQSRLNA